MTHRKDFEVHQSIPEVLVHGFWLETPGTSAIASVKSVKLRLWLFGVTEPELDSYPKVTQIREYSRSANRIRFRSLHCKPWLSRGTSEYDRKVQNGASQPLSTPTSLFHVQQAPLVGAPHDGFERLSKLPIARI